MKEFSNWNVIFFKFRSNLVWLQSSSYHFSGFLSPEQSLRTWIATLTCFAKGVAYIADQSFGFPHSWFGTYKSPVMYELYIENWDIVMNTTISRKFLPPPCFNESMKMVDSFVRHSQEKILLDITGFYVKTFYFHEWWM